MSKILESKNIFLYVSIVIFASFSIFYFVYVNKISYAFEYNNEDYLYDTKINLILKSSEMYAKNNEKLFKDKDTIYVTIDELVKGGYFFADKDDKVVDPRNDNKFMNELKIRITKFGDNYNSKILKK